VPAHDGFGRNDEERVLPSGQTRRAITQKSLSNGLMLGRECRRFKRDELLTQSKILEKETSPLAKEANQHSKAEPYKTKHSQDL
jgi:hypothetical protein